MESNGDLKYDCSSYIEDEKDDIQKMKYSLVWSIFGVKNWFQPNMLHPNVESIIYWRDVKTTGSFFGLGFLLLLSFACLSVISVIGYASLLILAFTVGLNVYVVGLKMLHKEIEFYPFDTLWDLDFTIPKERVFQFIDMAVPIINQFTADLHRLFLVEDFIDTLKFALILCCLVKLGDLFNLMTLVTLGFVLIFTLPKIYEYHQQTIDKFFECVYYKIIHISGQLKYAFTVGRKKSSASKFQKMN